MAQTVPKHTATVDDLDNLPYNGMHRELVRGEIREWEMSGPEHGTIEFEMAFALGAFVKPRRLGHVMVGEVRFLIRGDVHHARDADIAFVAANKYPSGRVPKKADATEPDLVVEVISPDDRPGMIQEKVDDWIDAGARLIWLVYPELREVHVFRKGVPPRVITHEGVLDGEDVLPGFTLPLRDFLP